MPSSFDATMAQAQSERASSKATREMRAEANPVLRPTPQPRDVHTFTQYTGLLARRPGQTAADYMRMMVQDERNNRGGEKPADKDKRHRAEDALTEAERSHLRRAIIYGQRQ